MDTFCYKAYTSDALMVWTNQNHRYIHVILNWRYTPWQKYVLSECSNLLITYWHYTQTLLLQVLPGSSALDFQHQLDDKENKALNPHGDQMPANHVKAEGLLVPVHIEVWVDVGNELITWQNDQCITQTELWEDLEDMAADSVGIVYFLKVKNDWLIITNNSL